MKPYPPNLITHSEFNSSSPRTSCTGRGPYVPCNEHTTYPRGVTPPPTADSPLLPSHEFYTWSSQALLLENQRQKNASNDRSQLQASGRFPVAPSLRRLRSGAFSL